MLAVILGAFAAHALKQRLDPEQLRIFEKGVTYQFYHSFALIATGILYSSFPHKALKSATVLFGLGILLFSGSLYLMAVLSTIGVALGPFGIITPFGGMAFIIGWACLLVVLLRKS